MEPCPQNAPRFKSYENRVSLTGYLAVLLFLIGIFLAGCDSVVDVGDSDDENKNGRPFELDPSFKCTNSTADEWSSLGLKEESIRSILIHPQNPQVIFAGTGFDFSAQRDGKIFRSTDCGESWELQYEGGSFHGLLLHPEDPYTLFAWNHRPTGGLLRTTDGGENWELHSEGMSTGGQNLTKSVLINQEKPEIMFAGTGAFGTGSLYKSMNGGDSWENITGNHSHLTSGPTAMFMHPDDPDLLLHSANLNGAISRSEDGGHTWDTVFFAEGLVRSFVTNSANSDQIIAASAGEGILISEDRGNSWNIEVELDVFLDSDRQNFRDIAYINNKLYVVTENGVLKTEDLEEYTWLNEGIVFGDSQETDGITLPHTLVVDVNEINMYVGNSRISIDDELTGGVYVREVD